MTFWKTAAALLCLTTTTGAAIAQTDVTVLSINRDDAAWRTLYEDTIADYNAAHPEVSVSIAFMEGEAYKKKLPTLLQSSAAPDIIFTWPGGVLNEQIMQGFQRPLPADVIDDWKAELSAGGMESFAYEGKYYGAPESVQSVAFWYNKDLAAQIGIDPSQIKTWDQFLEQVSAAKAAGVTPILVGGQDKWPLHFYYSLLAIRAMGQSGMAASAAGENGGFDNADWVRAGAEFRRLAALDPFQPGFMSARYDDASGLWGDGAGLFHLMGNWDLSQSRAMASNGGLRDEQLGVVPFPMLDGGKGNPTDTLGGTSGFVLTKGASDEAIDFLKVFMGAKAQSRAASEGLYIPSAPAAAPSVKDPILQKFAAITAQSTYHQLFLDQFFGSELGGAINDVSAQLATGDITPEEAAKSLEETRAFQ